MKVIIAGSRGFNDFELLNKKCNYYLRHQRIKDVEIVSGTARGADKLGEKYADSRGFRKMLFPANWDLHGKSAGYIRNEQMAKYADSLVAFWDGKSKGTKHMIDLAKKYNLKIKIVRYE